MTVDELVDRGIAAWNSRDPDRVAEDYGDGSVYWSPTLLEPELPGAEAAHLDAATTFRAFPDFTLVERHRIVSEAEGRAALWWEMTATFTGPLEPPGFAPTGGPVTNEGVVWLGAADGRIGRFHLYYDVNALGRQIGAVPPPGSAGEKMVVTFQRLTAKGLRRRDWTT